MKITKIEIKNFKAFRGPDVIDLGKKGQNLLLYGENGSGKTSLYEALKFFLESSEDDSIKFNRNIFINDKTDKGYIKLHFTPHPKLNKDNYEWSEDIADVQEHTLVQPIIDASKAKGFLDYKELLKTNYLHHEENSVNVFDLLINTLLKNVENDQTSPTISFSEQWMGISDVLSPDENAEQQIENPEEQEEQLEQLRIFNSGLAAKLVDLAAEASKILEKFRYKIDFNFVFHGVRYNSQEKKLYNKEILLTVKFLDEDIPSHHRFLNEAKLSAIALSIFFAGFKLQPPSALKILVIDDALIGLDISHRLPLADILDERDFSKYQTILMTYDRIFYEMVKKRKSEDKNWKAAELYCGKVDGYDIPVYVEDKTYLERAREYLNASDYKACAVYVRTAYEATLKRYCEKNNIGVKYREDSNELDSNDFWTLIRDRKIPDPKKNNKTKRLIKLVLVKKVELARKFTLNPLSHANIVNIPRKELEDAIEAVEWLEDALA